MSQCAPPTNQLIIYNHIQISNRPNWLFEIRFSISIADIFLIGNKNKLPALF